MKSILQVVQNLIKPYIDKVAKNIAPVEVSPSEHAYVVGRQIIYNGVLYTVTSAIAVNDNLEVGVNIISSSNILTQMTNKQSTYTADSTAWDTAPTENSTKPVTSGGVYQAITSVSIDDMTGATSSSDGEHGLVPAPLIADRDKYLKGDGTWQNIPNMTGATSAANGASGLVPQPLIANIAQFLRGDGAWATPTIERSYVGMIIHSTKLDTMAKVVAFYGGTTWIQHSGYMLRGATSGVTANSATKTGGADTVTITTNQMPSHYHGSYGWAKVSDNSGDYEVLGCRTSSTSQQNTRSTGGGQSHNNIPNYKSVYIWERTV